MTTDHGDLLPFATDSPTLDVDTPPRMMANPAEPAMLRCGGLKCGRNRGDRVGGLPIEMTQMILCAV